MADGQRNLAELGRAIDRIERELHENYVRKDVFDATVRPLVERGNTTWLSNRNALLAFGSTIAGVIATVFIARGGH